MSFPIIIIGGILAIPSLLIQAIVAPLVFIASLPALLVLIFRKKYNNNNNNNNNSRRCHVIITGGSSGIGLCVAQACVARKVDRITLLARNSETLKQAKEILLKQAASSETTKIDGISVDVTNPKAIQDAAKQVCQNDNSNSSTTTTTTTTYLFNCAGIAYPGYFEKMDSDIFTKTTNLNLLGTLYTTHAFLPYMMKSSGGTIVLVSSMGGQCGAFGYTAYAPTKIALKGFAEALHMELVNSDVNVQVVYPPDTDTPGYAEENKLKPKECFLISESVGFYKPDV
jgi:3-dehydrosphinganine reductase